MANKTKKVERDSEGQFTEPGTGTTDIVPVNAYAAAVETIKEKAGIPVLAHELRDFMHSEFDFTADMKTPDAVWNFLDRVSVKYWQKFFENAGIVKVESEAASNDSETVSEQ